MKSKEKIIVFSNSHDIKHFFSIGTEVKLLDFDSEDCSYHCRGLDGEDKGLIQWVNVKDLRRVSR